VINRTSFGKVPKHAAEDFFTMVMSAHVTAAAEQVMKDARIVSPDCKIIAESIVKKFVDISIPTTGDPRSGTSVGDSVYAYASNFLTMALLWHGFHDAIRMGDI